MNSLGLSVMTMVITTALIFAGIGINSTITDRGLIAGGNEVLKSSCSEDNDLQILVGIPTGERKLVITELKCQVEAK